MAPSAIAKGSGTYVRLEGAMDEESLLTVSLTAGALNYELFDTEDEPGAEVFTDIGNLETLYYTLQNSGFRVAESELRWLPCNIVEFINTAQVQSILKLIDTLESLDDVQNVTANFIWDQLELVY